VFVRRFSGEVLYWTSGAEELYGYTVNQAVGRKSHDLFKTEFPRPLKEINESLKREGRWQGLLKHTKSDGSKVWVQSRWRLRDSELAADALVIENNTDVTERENLSRELDHRVRNTLAIVQGLTRLTFPSDSENLRKFDQRLAALVMAHNILLQHHWTSAGLQEVLERALEPFAAPEQVEIDGENILLDPQSVLAYSLAFHELATNATKHGCFSVPEGLLKVSWQIFSGEKDRIHLFWRETGGPQPAPVRRGGSGLRLLEDVIAQQLGARVQLRFEKDGLTCEFDGPIQKEPVFEAGSAG
jgi:PAS domain S-box-containing protein